jgi:uncharacterized membrane protein
MIAAAFRRTTYPALYRYSGRIYIAAVVAGAVDGFVKAHGSPVTSFGFGTLAVIWAWSLWQAYRYARARDFATHEVWMIRNYSLTFAVPEAGGGALHGRVNVRIADQG